MDLVEFTKLLGQTSGLPTKILEEAIRRMSSLYKDSETDELGIIQWKLGEKMEKIAEKDGTDFENLKKDLIKLSSKYDLGFLRLPFDFNLRDENLINLTADDLAALEEDTFNCLIKYKRNALPPEAKAPFTKNIYQRNVSKKSIVRAIFFLAAHIFVLPAIYCGLSLLFNWHQEIKLENGKPQNRSELPPGDHGNGNNLNNNGVVGGKLRQGQSNEEPPNN